MYGNKYTSIQIAYVFDLKKIDAKVENTIIINNPILILLKSIRMITFVYLKCFINDF